MGASLSCVFGFGQVRLTERLLKRVTSGRPGGAGSSGETRGTKNIYTEISRKTVDQNAEWWNKFVTINILGLLDHVSKPRFFLQKQEYLCEVSRIQKMRRLYYCGFFLPPLFPDKTFYPLVARGVKRTVKCCKRKIAAPPPISPNPPFQFRTYVQHPTPSISQKSHLIKRIKRTFLTPLSTPYFPTKEEGVFGQKTFYNERCWNSRPLSSFFFSGKLRVGEDDFNGEV